MAYSLVSDLLIGDLVLSDTINPQTFVDAAADEIDARVGNLYALPLVGLAPHQLLMLKKISNNLATGRLVMATNIGHEDGAVHAYAQSLIDEANRFLSMIENGMYALGADKITGDEQSRLPATINRDAESPFTVFEDFTLARKNVYWRPGQ